MIEDTDWLLRDLSDSCGPNSPQSKFKFSSCPWRGPHRVCDFILWNVSLLLSLPTFLLVNVSFATHSHKECVLFN